MPTRLHGIKKIAFTGSHGTGKTTLATALATEIDIPIIEERARLFEQMGFELNTGAVLQTQLLMLFDQLAAESNPFAAWVADRCLIDYLAYSMSITVPPPKNIIALLESNIYWLMQNRYDHIFYVPTGKIKLLSDSLRPDDAAYQLVIDENIKYYLKHMSIPYHEIQSVTLTDRVQEVLEVIYP